MMYVSLHCTDYKPTAMCVEWKRNHSGEPVGSQDYFRVQVVTDSGEVTLYLSADQLDKLADRLSQAAQDRDVVLAEEGSKVSPVETGDGG